MQMVQIEQLIQGLFPYNNLSINCLFKNMLNSTFDNNKRMAKKTLFLYFQMLFFVVVYGSL